jgi:pyruvate/2-oxoglutarate dehydrogenase complex dihydrolipoamide acyltransferase (E2) component
MSIPIVLPELGAGGADVRVSSWLVDLGDEVDAGDRVVEVLLPGATFDVPAPAAGILTGIARPVDSVVRSGDTLGWIETLD